MKRHTLKFISTVLIVIAVAFVYQQKKSQAFSLVEQLDHYGWSALEQKEALQYLLQKGGILQENETLEMRYPTRSTQVELVADLVDLVDQTQTHFFKRGDNLERWEISAGKWMKEDIPELQKHLRALGMIDGVEPQNKTPDAVCILGASYPRMIKRIKYLEELAAKGFQPKFLILIAGERYVTVGVDGNQQELEAIANEFEIDDYKLLTETHLIQKAYQDSSLYKKWPMHIIDTPRGDERRPTTPMTIRELNDFLENHQDLKYIVFISNQPYVKYQEGMIRAVLKNVESPVVFEVIGTQVEQPEVTLPLIEGVGSYLYTSTPDLIGKLDVKIVDQKVIDILDRHYQKNPELYVRLKLKDDLMTVTPSLAQSYIGFMSRVGAGEEPSNLDAIFTSQVKKIENGKVLSSNISGLYDQLKSAQEIASPWDMNVLDILHDDENKTSVIRFTWRSDKLPNTYTTMVILREDGGKISEINEVYSQYYGHS